MKLVQVTIENFKSFKTRSEIPIGSGFNCIAGENGAGKSNLLDAVSFALGEQPNKLRVRTLSELAGIPNRRVEVEIIFEPTESLSSSTTTKRKTRFGNLILDGVRYYLLNGSRTPKHRFEEAVSELGLHVGNQAVWRITQTEINHKVTLSPSELYDAISVVSGTKLFNQRREEALKQVDTCRRTLTSVGEDLERLECEVEKDRAVVRDEERAEDLQLELTEKIPARRSSLEIRLSKVEFQQHTERVQSARKSLEASIAARLELEAKVDNLSKEKSLTEKVITHEASEKLRSEFSTAAAALEDIRARLLEIEGTRDQCAAFRSTLPGVMSALSTLENVDRPALFSRLHALRAAARAAAERLAEMEQQQKKSGCSESMEEMLALGLREAQCEAEKCKAQLALCETDASENLMIANAAATARLEAETKLSEVACQVEKLMSLCAASGGEEYEDVDMTGVGVENMESSLTSLEEQERALEKKRTQIARRCNSQASQMRCWLPAGSMPGEEDSQMVGEAPGEYLFQCFRIRAALEIGNSGGSSRKDTASEIAAEKNPYTAALDTILSPNLCVRIVESTEEGMAFAREARKNGKDCRVWARDRIDKNRDPAIVKQKQKHRSCQDEAPETSTARTVGEIIARSNLPGLKDPASLLCWSENDAKVNAAMRKALENWIIADDDATAEALLRTRPRANVRVVTKNGNQHSIGRLIGSSRGAQHVYKIELAIDLRELLQRKAEVDNDLLSTRKQILALRKSEGIVWELATLKKTVVAANARLLRARADETSAEAAAVASAAKVSMASETHVHALAATAEAKKNLSLRNSGKSSALLLESLQRSSKEADANVIAAEEALGALEEHRDTLLESLRPSANSKTSHDLEERILQAAASGGQKCESLSSNPSECFQSAAATMEACDGALAIINDEVGNLKSELAVAEASKEIAMGAKAEAEVQDDKIRQQQHETKKKMQKIKQAVVEERIKGKALEADAVASEKALAKAGAKLASLTQNSSWNDLPTKGSSGGVDSELNENRQELTEKSLKSALHTLSAEEASLREELRGLKRRKCRSSKSQAVNRGTLEAKVSACATLREQMAGVYEAISVLETGLESAVTLMKSANSRCFAAVRLNFADQVARLLPGKRGLLEPLSQASVAASVGGGDLCAGSNDNLEEGIVLAVGSAVDDDKDISSRRSVNELSGGQKALVGLALTFAMARYRCLPLYILDEIDAPLDEHNQGSASQAVGDVLSGAQVLCVSHHAPFHRQADTIIQITRQNESSKFLRAVDHTGQVGSGLKRGKLQNGTSGADGEKRRR